VVWCRHARAHPVRPVHSGTGAARARGLPSGCCQRTSSYSGGRRRPRCVAWALARLLPPPRLTPGALGRGDATGAYTAGGQVACAAHVRGRGGGAGAASSVSAQDHRLSLPPPAVLGVQCKNNETPVRAHTSHIETDIRRADLARSAAAHQPDRGGELVVCGAASARSVRLLRPWAAGLAPAPESGGTTAALGTGTAGMSDTGLLCSDMDMRRSCALGPSACMDGAATDRRGCGLAAAPAPKPATAPPRTVV
jgi:hypothetical protein